MRKDINSILFVPAEEKRLSKIAVLNADAFIIDLEDSISDEHKDEALATVVAFLDKFDFSLTTIFVRINKHKRRLELEELQKYPVGIMLPKFEESIDYSDVESYLSNKETIALIETPKALCNASVISNISWIDALAFGAEDFTANANILNVYDNLYVPKYMLSLAAKAYNKLVFDTPCFKLDDVSILEAELKQAVKLGYNGKLAIHPKQIDVINTAFSMNNKESLMRIVEIYEKSGKAVCEIDGSVYEKMHIDRIKRNLGL